MEKRRSINFFDKNKKIDNDILEKIINLAVLAPSAFNLQPWRIIAVKSDEAKEKLYEVAFKQPKILEAPVTLIIIGDKAGAEATNPAWTFLEELIGKEQTAASKKSAASLYSSTEERKIKFAESNGGLLAMSIMLAAEHYGVQSHPVSGINFSGLKSSFNLGENEDTVMLICLGYFDESKKLYPRLKRRGFKEIVELV